MDLGQFLTNEEKIASLEHVKRLLSVEIYRICLSNGMNPDTFDYSTYVRPVGNFDYRLGELEKHSKNLVSLVSKLEDLKNA